MFYKDSKLIDLLLSITLFKVKKIFDNCLTLLKPFYIVVHNCRDISNDSFAN